MDKIRHSKINILPVGDEIIKNTVYYKNLPSGEFELYVSDKDGTVLNKLSLDYNTINNLPQLFSGNYNDLSNKPDLTVLNDTIILPLFTDLPTTGEEDKVYIISETGYMYRWNGTGYTQLTDQTAIWGQIGGDINNQPDLINTFVKKSGDTMSGDLIIESDNKPSIKLEQNNSLYNGVLLSETGFGYLNIKPTNDKYGFLLRAFDSNDWFVGGVIGNNQNTFNSLLSGDGYNLSLKAYHIYTGNNTDIPVMSFNVDKNVGIGTTTPDEKLDVEGNVKATLFMGDGSGLTNLPKRQIKEITTATYTLVAEDIDKILHFNSATAQTVTVPNLLVGNISETRIEGKQIGAGEVSFVGATGVNIRLSGNGLNTTGGQYSVFGLDKIADNEFVLFGKLKQ